jgi:hypothetical protein
VKSTDVTPITYDGKVTKITKLYSSLGGEVNGAVAEMV